MHASTTRSLTDDETQQNPPSRFRWRVVDIVVAAVIGVASGVVFWLWGLAYTPLAALLAFTPGLEGLTAGGWLFAGVLGGLIVRRPGAAVFTSLIAGVIEASLGNAWGTGNILFALIQGLGAEAGLAMFRYRSSSIGVASIAGALAGVANVVISLPIYYVGVTPEVQIVYALSAIVSGVVLGGIVSWLLSRGLVRTGALNRFPVAQRS